MNVRHPLTNSFVSNFWNNFKQSLWVIKEGATIWLAAIANSEWQLKFQLKSFFLLSSVNIVVPDAKAILKKVKGISNNFSCKYSSDIHFPDVLVFFSLKCEKGMKF